MPRVKVGPAPPDASTLDVEIARLRDLDSVPPHKRPDAPLTSDEPAAAR